MSAPKRIQMRRDRPWRAENPDAVIVARPSAWGNPFRVGKDHIADAKTAVRLYRKWLNDQLAICPGPTREALDDLRGKDLACWCPLDAPCHADVLLEIANREEGDAVFATRAGAIGRALRAMLAEQEAGDG